MKNYFTLKNLGWLFTALVSLMLGMSGISKIIGTQETINNFTFMNLLPYMGLIGLLEVVGVILLIVPKTSKYGAILISSILSGSVALHLAMMGGENVILPISFGLGAWMAHCLRSYTSK